VTLVYIEQSDSGIDDLSLQALTFARSVAGPTATLTEAVTAEVLGDAALESLRRQGVSTLHVLRTADIDGYAPAALARGVAELAQQRAAAVVMAPSSDHGNEVMAHTAAILDQPLATDVLSLTLGAPATVARARWGGSLIEHAEVMGEPLLVTLAAHSVEVAEVSPAELAVLDFEVTLRPLDAVVVASKVQGEGSSSINLADAKVVVSGGRGVGSTEGFAVLEELADLLGGAVGCSRVVTSAGWRPHTDQVGQTGTKVAPDLYIACGISGATQHLAGCRTSKTMLVINNDPEASIMAHADYAIIGDLHTVLPAVVAEVRKAQSP